MDLFFKTIYEINKKRKKQKVKTKNYERTVNNNFIVQRFFNVKGYNPKSKNSVELLDLMEGFVEKLKRNFKMKTMVYMTDNSYEIMENPEVLNTSFTDGPEVFNIYLKNGNDVMMHWTFDAKLYPPKVRYTVDVRPFLKDILNSLTEVFSEKKLTHEYMGYSLV